ncbi:hypothetical protein [Streptomyces carpinensis]|uniref:Transposase n=1 Tax=Streptomyces carpinensis TaxID=66369 RepID=A0ABV1VYF7_9ACTN|nr:hypothetical protein [Streptomyces carpinensis]
MCLCTLSELETLLRRRLKAIDHLNGDMKTAYGIANTLGTGDCANTGAGEVPQGLSHIS